MAAIIWSHSSYFIRFLKVIYMFRDYAPDNYEFFGNNHIGSSRICSSITSSLSYLSLKIQRIKEN